MGNNDSKHHGTLYQHAMERVAENLERGRGAMEQASLLPILDPPSEGRKRAANKTRSALAKYLTAQGYSLPVDQLAALAGLTTGKDPMQAAMERMEIICAAAGVTGSQSALRAKIMLDVLKEMRLASDSMMPYTAKKLTPDVAIGAPQILIQAAPALDGIPQASPYDPPPMPKREALEYQALSNAEIPTLEIEALEETSSD